MGYLTVSDISIPFHKEELRLPVSDLSRHLQPYVDISIHPCFVLVFDDDLNLTSILHFNQERLVQEFQYSHKGNLARYLYYPDSGIHSKIVSVYDYSSTERTLKEKRFYTYLTGYSKKEVYTKDQMLSKIVYIHRGDPYCIEYFSDCEDLIKVEYYNKCGLIV